MIVQHRQGMTAARFDGEMPFEIHLPQIVGVWMLEALKGGVLLRLGRLDAPVPMQDGRDGTGSRHVAATCTPWA